MSFLGFLLCVCLLTAFGVFFGLKFFSHRLRNVYSSELIETSVLYLGLLLGGSVLCAGGYLPVSFLVLLGIGGTSTIGISVLTPSKSWKCGLSALLCYLSVLFLYQFYGYSLFYSLILAVVWGILWAVFVFFNRYPLTSSLVSFAWMLGIVCVGLIISEIPRMLIAGSALLGTSVMMFSHFKTFQKKLVLNETVSFFIGFLWAGVWTYFVSQGGLFQTITAYGYYLFEGIILGLTFFFHKKSPSFLSDNVLKFSSKSTAIIFSHLLILSFLSMMTMRMNQNIVSVLIFALIIVLLDLYMRLNALENPLPTWREMFRDTKDSVIILANEIKSRKQKAQNNSPLKKPVKKKTQKRKSQK